jgi:hypothetical protein
VGSPVLLGGHVWAGHQFQESSPVQRTGSGQWLSLTPLWITCEIEPRMMLGRRPEGKMQADQARPAIKKVVVVREFEYGRNLLLRRSG